MIMHMYEYENDEVEIREKQKLQRNEAIECWRSWSSMSFLYTLYIYTFFKV